METVLPTGETPLLVRDVTPPTMTARPRPTTLAQAHAPSPTPAAPAEKDRQERLFNPIVVGAGTLKTRDGEIHLAGIAAPAFEAMCGEKPAQWPCGHMARAALQKFIHSRAVECTIPAGADKIPDPAECQVGGGDMSEWLVAQGWAKHAGAKFEDETFGTGLKQLIDSLANRRRIRPREHDSARAIGILGDRPCVERGADH